MPTVNMHEAKTNLSKLVQAVETGAEQEVVISRNGKPVARLVPIEQSIKPVRKNRLLGIAEGMFGDLDAAWFEDWQAMDKPIQEAFAARLDKFDDIFEALAKKESSQP